MRELIENVNKAKEVEAELYMAIQSERTISREAMHNYSVAQDELVEAKEACEEVLKQFRDFVESSPELFIDEKANQIMEWLLLASVKLEDI